MADTAQPDPLDDLAVGYVLPTEEEVRSIWSQATIAVDANVLLNIYRYSPTAREQLLTALETVETRLFVPHQAAKEYFLNRLHVLMAQLSAKAQLRSGIEDAIESFLRAIRDTHAGLSRRESPDEIVGRAREGLQTIRDEVLATEESRLDAIDKRDDVLHARLMTILRGRVGTAPSEAELQRLKEEAQRRYEAERPPGYLDAKDKDDGGVGDFILWSQVLDHAEAVSRPIVLVTDDVKDDWVWRVKGQTLGPRPELVREMHLLAGAALLLNTTSSFLERIAAEGSTAIDADVIREAKAREQPQPSPVRLPKIFSPVRGRPDPSVTEKFMRYLAEAQKEPRLTSSVGAVSAQPPWNAALHAYLEGNTFGALSCLVTSPAGRTYFWSDSVSSESSIQLDFPEDFATASSNLPVDQAEIQEGVYDVSWRLALGLGRIGNVLETRDRFSLGDPFVVR